MVRTIPENINCFMDNKTSTYNKRDWSSFAHIPIDRRNSYTHLSHKPKHHSTSCRLVIVSFHCMTNALPLSAIVVVSSCYYVNPLVNNDNINNYAVFTL